MSYDGLRRSAPKQTVSRLFPRELTASRALACKLQRLTLAGLLLSAAACNRVEPEKSSDAKGEAAPSAVEAEQAETAATTPRPIATDIDVPSGQLPANAAASPSVLPPAGQAVAATGASQNGTASGSAAAGPAPSGSTAGKQSTESGVHIEMTTPSLPTAGADTGSVAVNEAISQRLADRDFMKLAMPESNRPDDLLQFFGQCDKAIQDLTITAHTQQLSEAEFHEHAKRLSQLKLAAAERLLSLNGLTREQQKRATSAHVESLSHLTSLGDVVAAQKLQTLAQELSQSSDHELAHQGKLVLLGFCLNQLLEGQIKDPQTLLTDMQGLFETQDDRGLVEMMALQRCADVLSQLGYSDESKQVLNLIVKEYRDSPDAELSMRAWGLETNGSPEMAAYNEALQATLSGSEKDPTRIARASADLLRAFPSVNTLWQVTRSIIPLEFSGNVPAASEVAKVATEMQTQLKTGPLSVEIDNFLDCHMRRLAIRGQPLNFKELATFDGQPLDWESYRGKVVLVCFWASWDLNSLSEIERLSQLRQEVPSKDFEILTINLDDANRGNAGPKENYPWVTLRSSNPAAVGFNTLAAKELGVNAVPFMLLVDRKGRVAAIHARGEKTVTMINELLSAK